MFRLIECTKCNNPMHAECRHEWRHAVTNHITYRATRYKCDTCGRTSWRQDRTNVARCALSPTTRAISDKNPLREAMSGI